MNKQECIGIPDMILLLMKDESRNSNEPIFQNGSSWNGSWITRKLNTRKLNTRKLNTRKLNTRKLNTRKLNTENSIEVLTKIN